MKISVFRFSIAALLAATTPLWAQDEAFNQALIEKVARNATPFECFDVTYTKARFDPKTNETKTTRHRLRLERASGKLRREEILNPLKAFRNSEPWPTAMHYLVEVWDGARRTLYEQIVDGKDAKFGMPLSEGDAVYGSERPQVIVPYIGLYAGRIQKVELAAWLRSPVEVGVSKLADDRYELLVEKRLRLVVDPGTGLILEREDLVLDQHGQPYAHVAYRVKSRFDADVLHFPAETDVTWQDESGILKVDTFTVEEESLRVNVPLDPGVFTIDVPEGAPMLDMRTGQP